MWGEIPLSCPQGKGVSVPGELTERPPLTHLPARHSGRRGEMLQLSGERDGRQEPKRGTGMAGLHKDVVGAKGSRAVRCAHLG